MFTLKQMKAAHAKVKSGADFPVYVREIKQLGLLHYEYSVKDGRTVYHGAKGFLVSGDPIYPEKKISEQVSPETVRQIISEHQLGRSDFADFCQLVAEAGIEKWVIDTQAMVCIYYDLSGRCIVTEPIPDRNLSFDPATNSLGLDPHNAMLELGA